MLRLLRRTRTSADSFGTRLPAIVEKSRRPPIGFLLISAMTSPALSPASSAALQLRALRRTIPQHIGNQHSPGLCSAELLGQFLIQLLDGDTQITPDDLSALDQLLHNRADHVAGNRKPDSHVPSTLAENGGI